MTPQDASTKVRTHIATKGHVPVRVTKHLVRYWWNVLNAAVFNNELPNARHIELLDTPEVYAWAIPASNGRIDLHIQPSFVQRTTFLTVLIHEMVHAWEFMTFGRMGHGSRFLGWATTIEQHTSLILRKSVRDYEHTRRPRRNPK